MTVWEAIGEAEATLPGRAAPDEEIDPRWQAIIKVAGFIESEPEAVWVFIVRWGCHEDEDLRTAVATVLSEHLLGHHFADFFPKVTKAVEENALLGDTFSRCHRFGQSNDARNAPQFDGLKSKCRSARK